ncbi:MAG TPA: RIP metalloprotease RseP [Rhodocyclaceae bacterium]
MGIAWYWYAGGFIVALGVLVTIHELGHFLAAQVCGVKVLRFSVGFGRALYTRQCGRDQTEWVVAAIPLGGYVRMLDEREGEVAPHEAHRAFNRQSLSRKALVVVAGPAANLLFAVLFYWLMFVLGVDELRPVVALPAAGTPAAVAGVPEGATIKAVDGETTLSWTDTRIALLEGITTHRPIKLDVETESGASASYTLEIPADISTHPDQDLGKQLGLMLYRPSPRPVIGDVKPRSAAAEAGLKSGDEIVEIDGSAIHQWSQVVEAIRGGAGKQIALAIRRDGEVRTIKLTPRAEEEGGKTIGRMGAMVKIDPALQARLFTVIRYDPLTAVGKALAQTWDTIRISLVMMGRMVTGAISWRNLSGPVAIADYAGQSAALGIVQYLRFLALISVSLGVLNLLPVPVLDGGHLMYYLAEFFKGSPVSERSLEIGQRLGLVLLGLLMAGALYNDLVRLFRLTP